MYREEQLKSLLQGHRILIAGYGREGQSAERLIRRLVPEVQYTIAVQVENGKWKGLTPQPPLQGERGSGYRTNYSPLPLERGRG
jgi:hypothetical protein